MSADYNGWADQREEEREALDQLADVAPAGRPRLPRVRRELLVRAAAREILRPLAALPRVDS
jgi:hypothetical protein